VKAANTAGTFSAYSANGSVVIDTVPPGITNLLASSGTDTTENITWTTDKLSSTQVQYGPTVSYGTTSALSDTSPRATSHSVDLSGLVACTLYHYKVTSTDATGNSASSADSSFITSGCAGTAVVTAHADAVVPQSAGGNVSLSDSGKTVSLAVPANFAGVDADFQIKKIDASTALGTIGTPPGLSTIGSVYDIKAMQDATTAITSFNGEVAVTMTYTDEDLAAFQESTLVIYRWDDGPGWRKLNNCVTDTSAHTVTCYTPGFSTFGLFGEHTAAAAPTVGTTKVAPRWSSPTPAAPTDTVATNDTAQPLNSTSKPAETQAPAPEQKSKSGPSKKTSHKVWWWSGLALVVLAGSWWIILAWRRRKRDQEEAT
jgi:hypothetical protein